MPRKKPTLSDNDFWTMQDMMLYTEKRFLFHGILVKNKEFPEYFDSALYNSYRDHLRKKLTEYNLCFNDEETDKDKKKDNDKKTGKDEETDKDKITGKDKKKDEDKKKSEYKYSLIGFLAKPFLDREGEYYFHSRLYEENHRQRVEDFIAKRNEEKNYEAHQEMQKRHYEDYLPAREAEQAGTPAPPTMPASQTLDMIKDYGGYSPQNEALFVEQTMIRAVASVFFDFDEERLRHDFQHFFIHCFDETGEPCGDYSLMKYRLEHPQDYYYSLKGKKRQDNLLRELRAMQD